MSQSESLKPSLLDPRLLGEAIINASNMPDGTIAIDGKRLVFAPDADSVFIDLSKLSAALAHPRRPHQGHAAMTAAFNWMAHHPWPTLWLILPLCVALPCWMEPFLP